MGTAETKSIGISVLFPEHKSVKINSVKSSGLLPNWNRQHQDKPEYMVRAGDVIVSANGVFDNSVLMMAQLRDRKKLHLLVKHDDSQPIVAPVATAPVVEPPAVADEP